MVKMIENGTKKNDYLKMEEEKMKVSALMFVVNKTSLWK